MTDRLLAFIDAEDICQAWLKSTDVNTLVDGKIFQSMPAGSEKLRNVITLSRVGGSPSSGDYLPEDRPRISFSVYGQNRQHAKRFALELVRQIELLGVLGGYSDEFGHLPVGNTLNMVWAPDGNFARYLVDAEFVVVGDPESD